MSITQLTLAEYRALAAELSPPDVEQRHDFACYVAGAHSWYKHLPALRPGAPFYFFYDPVAGLERYRPASGGGLAFREKPRGGDFFHYNEMPTCDYRRRFGWLSYSCNRGTQILYSTLGGVADNKLSHPVIHTPQGDACHLPDEAMAAGKIELTGTIHTYMTTQWLTRGFATADRDKLRELIPDDPELPGEWLDYLTRSGESHSHVPARLTQRLEGFIKRDRQRQIRAILETLGAVTELAFGSG